MSSDFDEQHFSIHFQCFKSVSCRHVLCGNQFGLFGGDPANAAGVRPPSIRLVLAVFWDGRPRFERLSDFTQTPTYTHVVHKMFQRSNRMCLTNFRYRRRRSSTKPTCRLRSSTWNRYCRDVSFFVEILLFIVSLIITNCLPNAFLATEK